MNFGRFCHCDQINVGCFAWVEDKLEAKTAFPVGESPIKVARIAYTSVGLMVEASESVQMFMSREILKSAQPNKHEAGANYSSIVTIILEASHSCESRPPDMGRNLLPIRSINSRIDSD